jgi:hypothetical protein
MRLYDVENSAQVDIVDSGQDIPVMDRTMQNNLKDKFRKLKVS